MTPTTARAGHRHHRPSLSLRFLLRKLLSAALLIAVTALPVGRALADIPGGKTFSEPTLHIFLYEGGTPVDETANCSYSESHIISLVSQQVLGVTLAGDPQNIYDADSQVVGYLLWY